MIGSTYKGYRLYTLSILWGISCASGKLGSKERPLRRTYKLEFETKTRLIAWKLHGFRNSTRI